VDFGPLFCLRELDFKALIMKRFLIAYFIFINDSFLVFDTSPILANEEE